MEPFVEAFVKVNSMKASMDAFVEIPKASVKIMFTEAFFESFVEASVGDLVTVISMEFFVNDSVEVTFCKVWFYGSPPNFSLPKSPVLKPTPGRFS